MRQLIRAVILAVFVASLGGWPATAFEEIAIGTRDGLRTAIVLRVPRRAPPAVIVLHGASGSAERTLRRSGFAEAAARHGFAAVFPEGIGWQWNDGRQMGSAGTDDVGFLRRLVGELATRRVADPARVYIAGISNGGMMTFRMLCEASELFAGAGAIIASMPVEVGASCRLRRPVSVVMFNGTVDPLVPYEGGGVWFIGRRGSVWPAERTAAFLARDNGCLEYAELALGSGSRADVTRVARLGWFGCSMGHSVTLYRVEGGGHQIFGHRNTLPFVFGPGTDQISAPDTIMAAFAGQQEVAEENRYVSGRPALRRPSR